MTGILVIRRSRRDVAVLYLPNNNRSGIDHLRRYATYSLQRPIIGTLDRLPTVNVRRRSIIYRNCAWPNAFVGVGGQTIPIAGSMSWRISGAARLVKPW
jgi:hypothetical protein